MSTKGENEFCFTWKIKNFSFCCDLVLESPPFKADCLGENVWNLGIVTRYVKENGKEVTLCLLKMNEETEDVHVDYRIELIDSNGRVLKSVENKNKLFKESDSNFFDVSIEIDREELDSKLPCEELLIFRCYLKNADSKKQVNGGGIEAQTKIGVDHQCFEQMAIIPVHGSLCYKREIFNLEYIKFEVEISRPRPESGDLDVLKVKIFETGECTHRFMCCEISILDTSEMDVFSESFSHYFKTENEVWELPSITRDKLRDLFDENYEFTARFEFSVSSRTESHRLLTSKFDETKCKVVPYFACEQPDGFLSLQNDLRLLFESKKHADVELRAESAVFPVHKSILVARSPVLKTMFDQNMVESQTGVVELSDVDEKVLRVFLEYLYTGAVRGMDYECAKHLLLVSDKYRVESLRKECSSYLTSALSVKNVCEVFVLADMITDKKLKASALDFMTIHAEEMLPLPEWSEWMKNNSKLSIEILSNMVLSLKIKSKNEPK